MLDVMLVYVGVMPEGRYSSVSQITHDCVSI